MYNPYDSEKYPKRKKPRLQGYDYSTSNYYFVTVCTFEKQCIFGKPEELNELGKIVEQGIAKIPEHFPGTKMDGFVVMPNHIHMLIFLPGGRSKLEHIIGSLKSYVTREIHRLQPDLKIWQTSFHDHIIRNEKAYQKIWLYIESNPRNWAKDCFYHE